MAKDVSPMSEKIDPFFNNIQKPMYTIMSVATS
jgi:hypothetical protein